MPRHKEPNCNSPSSVGPFSIRTYNPDHDLFCLPIFQLPVCTSNTRDRSSAVGKGLKANEPKLFTWSDLACTNTGGPGMQPCILRVYALSDTCRLSKRCWHKQLWRTLWNESSPLFFSSTFSFKTQSTGMYRVELYRSVVVVAWNRGKLLMFSNVYQYHLRHFIEDVRLKMKTKTKVLSIDATDLIIETLTIGRERFLPFLAPYL